MDLRISPCRTLCDWRPTRVAPLFACTGCGSQWAPSEPWTPRQADGTVPDAVRAALGTAAGTAPGTGLSTAPAADAAGSAGS